ncbi:MAG: hypothetical protein RLZZ292_3592, partial [Bacteroidota bacterium]
MPIDKNTIYLAKIIFYKIKTYFCAF